MIKQELDNFDWEELDFLQNQSRFKINQKIVNKYPDSNVYCHEKYALELYEEMIDNKTPIISKDFEDGDVIKVLTLRNTNNKYELVAELENSLFVNINLTKEKAFAKIFNLDFEDFVYWLNTEKGLNEFMKYDHYVKLEGNISKFIAHLYKGHIINTEYNLYNEISNPTVAYFAKVKDRNGSGYIVDVDGVEGFLPGSLAAPNKIVDFDSYIGKEIIVMVEAYTKQTNTFIFSHKKYIEHILPTKVKELDLMKLYTGVITDTTKFGIFIEFDDIYTGLLHKSKMDKITFDKFKKREYEPGHEIEFYIKNIEKNNKIVLTTEDPMYKINKYEDFSKRIKGLSRSGVVVNKLHFGYLIELEKDVIGLLPKKELDKKTILKEGDDVIVTVDDVKKDKIFLSLPNETKYL